MQKAPIAKIHTAQRPRVWVKMLERAPIVSSFPSGVSPILFSTPAPRM